MLAIQLESVIVIEWRVRQLNCVKLHCQDLLGDNPERLFLGGAKIHPQIQITRHLTENLHIFLK